MAAKKVKTEEEHVWELVVVTWEDAAFSGNSDFAAGELLEPIQLVTCGFVLKETKKYITLAGEYNPLDNSTRHQWVIPRSGVKNIQRYET